MIDRLNTEYPDFMPDYKRWLRKDLWSLDEAVCLLRKLDPDKRDHLFRLNKGFKEQFKDDLNTARRAAHRSLATIPGTVDYMNGDTDTTVEPDDFIRWADSQGYEIPEQLLHLLDDVEEKNVTIEPSNEVGSNSQLPVGEASSKISLRVKDIVLLANTQFTDTMKIPDGGKKQLMETLCKLKPDLFTESTFKKAWQEAINQEKVKMENHKQFGSGK